VDRRRAGAALIWLGALLASRGAIAQGKVRVIGVLTPRSHPAALETDYVGAFPRRMRELGYVEGKNVRYEWRFADGNLERLPSLAAELVQLKVDVIVAGTTAGVRAAQQATRTIPIVMAAVGDPVGSGLVASLGRPGGNTTGQSIVQPDTSAKQLELLASAVRKLSRVGFLLIESTQPLELAFKNAQSASRKAGIEVVRLPARNEEEIERAFSGMKQQGVDALIVPSSPVYHDYRHVLAAIAAKNRVAVIYGTREHAEAGGLMSYGVNISDYYRGAANYVDRILKGASPASLPVEQPTRLELVINLKAASALGITFPAEVLLRADHVIK
jgi:putative ABC transport system substrate-binding protein